MPIGSGLAGQSAAAGLRYFYAIALDIYKFTLI